MSRFTSTYKINSRWRNNDFVGDAGSSHTFPDAFHEEFLVDWAPQIANGAIVITETPTTGNIQASSLTVANLVVTGSATGSFGGSTIIGTSPISVSTASNTSTISLNANYATSTHLHDADYVNVTGDTMSGQLLVSSATTTTTVGFGEIIVAKGTSYGSITVNATDDHIHIRSKNPVEILAQSTSTMQGIRARGLGVNSTHTYPTLIDDGITFGEDANLYRVSANALKTDDALEVVGNLTKGGTAVSLSGHTHSYQPAGTYVTSVTGTAPISASTDSAGISTVSLTASYSTSTHNHSGVYQAAGTYLTAISGTSPVSASANTAGAATISVSTGTTSATVALGSHTHSGLAPVGGTTGQVLAKVSATDYDYSWSAAGGGSSLSNTAAIALGTASAGVATDASRQDHVHPTTNLATLTGTETLTNKTLTAPVLTRALMSTTIKSSTATTLTLTNTSDFVQYISGATSGGVLMPDTTTLQLYTTYNLINQTSSQINIYTSDQVGGTFAQVPSGWTMNLTAINISSNVITAWVFRQGGGSFSGSGAYALATSPQFSGTPTISAIRYGTIAITTAGTTTTLTNTSSVNQLFTGTLNQTVKLPSSFNSGQTYQIFNESTGNVTITASDNSVVTTLAPAQMQLILGNTSNGTTQAAWSKYLLHQTNQGIILQRTTGFTITSTTLPTTPSTSNTQAIAWTSAAKVNTSMWTSGSTITAPVAGYYTIKMSLNFAGASFAAGAYIFQGSTLVEHVEQQAGANTSYDSLMVASTIYCAASDVITASVAASTTGKTITVGAQNGYFSMVFIGAQA